MSNCSTSFAQAAYPIAPEWNATTGGRFYPYHGDNLNPLPASSDNNWVSPPIGLVGGKKKELKNIKNIKNTVNPKKGIIKKQNIIKNINTTKKENHGK